MAEGFADKLSLVLKALSISRGRLAADVGVDKSLVGRWCNGQVSPSAHNCARLTQAIAARQPGFTMLDWEHDLPALGARFGVTVSAPPPPPSAVPSGFAEWLAVPKFREAALASGPASTALAGFWRTTRPVPEFPGKFVHDHVIMQTSPDGPLRFRIGLFSSRLVGWSMAVGDQMFCCASNQLTGSSIFAIFNRVHRPRIDCIDGVTLACMADAGGVPVAAACMLERVGDLSGDDAADDAHYEALLAEHPIAPDGSVPDHVVKHLWRDTGPTALAQGGDAMIMIRSMASLARGSSPAAAPPTLRVVSG
ncbi:helix-turn-helix transcriptional regulator [Glacieibacterium frigidum]|uniref:Helix-turn-helix transcriptional regulator n=1 Tax=Glacieibacterium frigidum TaxID=2593303 RepID=A0A552UHG5_9SPHN|nr:helix-turn-helix transcriptional regulator [Glacieibacterium frigidum]TRW17640.1 helix-turn-helix transcriptional regulator [Glacieibacterium frigidum]